MGSYSSKADLARIDDIQQQATDLEKSFHNLSGSLYSLTTSLVPKTDVDTKISEFEESHSNLNRKVDELLKVAEEQQKQIAESRERYIKLCDEQLQRQRTFKETSDGFEARFKKYDDEIASMHSKFIEIDELIAKDAEEYRTLSINKTQNMIAKLKPDERRNAKKSGKKPQEDANNNVEMKHGQDKVKFTYLKKGETERTVLEKKLLTRSRTSTSQDESLKEIEITKTQRQHHLFQSPL